MGDQPRLGHHVWHPHAERAQLTVHHVSHADEGVRRQVEDLLVDDEQVHLGVGASTFHRHKHFVARIARRHAGCHRQLTVDGKVVGYRPRQQDRGGDSCRLFRVKRGPGRHVVRQPLVATWRNEGGVHRARLATPGGVHGADVHGSKLVGDGARHGSRFVATEPDKQGARREGRHHGDGDSLTVAVLRPSGGDGATHPSTERAAGPRLGGPTNGHGAHRLVRRCVHSDRHDRMNASAWQLKDGSDAGRVARGDDGLARHEHSSLRVCSEGQVERSGSGRQPVQVKVDRHPSDRRTVDVQHVRRRDEGLPRDHQRRRRKGQRHLQLRLSDGHARLGSDELTCRAHKRHLKGKVGIRRHRHPVWQHKRVQQRALVVRRDSE
mmetsp:Transcript_9926/g.31467  ORF Transcript_9926/g.31467 Transcript_9926/m.31467 type:complete len:379 (-) Transcript_9926:2608-3744(-)